MLAANSTPARGYRDHADVAITQQAHDMIDQAFLTPSSNHDEALEQDSLVTGMHILGAVTDACGVHREER